MPIKTLQDATTYIYDHIPYGGKSDLSSMRHLMQLLGNPQDDLRFIHLTGTNGKGSTAAFIFHILSQTSLNVGLFTSPFIHKFNERFRFNDHDITDDAVVSLVNFLKPLIDNLPPPLKPGPFEILTAMAFLYFKQVGADVVVLEVGIGGTYDPTNVISTTLVSVITAIGYDHMDKLGHTLLDIATQKAGIIKPNTPVVIYPPVDETIWALFKQTADQNNAPAHFIHSQDVTLTTSDWSHQRFAYKHFVDMDIALLGDYQLLNASVAIETICCLQQLGYDISTTDIYSGLKNTTWMGRFEIMSQSPLFILDGAHNTSGAQTLLNNLTTLCPQTKFIFIIGMLRKKEYETILKPFISLAHEFVTIAARADDAALSPDELTTYLSGLGASARSIPDVASAVAYALQVATEHHLAICAFGSLYYLAHVRDFFNTL